MSKIAGAKIVSGTVALAALVAAAGIAVRWATTCDAWIGWLAISLAGLIAFFTRYADYKEVEDTFEPDAIDVALDKADRKSMERTFKARVARFKILIGFAIAVTALAAVGTNTFIVDPICKARSVAVDPNATGVDEEASLVQPETESRAPAG